MWDGSDADDVNMLGVWNDLQGRAEACEQYIASIRNAGVYLCAMELRAFAQSHDVHIVVVGADQAVEVSFNTAAQD